ncbi:Aste57867_1469 [Aphanomyces stellatus]|uniref:Aste57867_1469 protein n=1 Tax=Aphanomyces stellatus TaxID=120398 RepID=A0A485K5D0_9STRA|nr:hypothetical protein As57867_001468 [Aphanomyces stellatus]VFT78685.1 Aste57867_1469 [Aphanomyces stellatus]
MDHAGHDDRHCRLAVSPLQTRDLGLALLVRIVDSSKPRVLERLEQLFGRMVACLGSNDRQEVTQDSIGPPKQDLVEIILGKRASPMSANVRLTHPKYKWNEPDGGKHMLHDSSSERDPILGKQLENASS